MYKVKLSNGHEMPVVGYGTWKLKDKPETTEIILDAINASYRHFDTAYAYGNEIAVGKAFHEANVSREEMFITGKLWNDDRDRVGEAYNRTVKNLQCEYLDLYLMHWPASKAVHENWVEINASVWDEMEKLYEAGKVKAIGVCNFNVSQLEELKKTAKIMPMVNQIEFHIGQMQDEIRKYCKEQNIVVEAWSPLGSGKMLKVETLQVLAEKYGVSVAQLCIRWCLQNDVVPIPKSKDSERMRQNLDVFNFEISDDDVRVLNEMPYVGGSGLDSETITLFG